MSLVSKIWDKQSPINGVQPEEFLKDNFFAQARQIFLLIDDVSDRVTNVESVDVIKSMLELPKETDDETVIARYIEFLEEQKAEAKRQRESAVQCKAAPMAVNSVDNSGEILTALQTIAEKLDAILAKMNA